MNDSRTMIREIVKDILQAKLKESLPDILSTILQQKKPSADKLLHIIRDIPVQTKAMTMDKTSVLTTATQGASIELLLESDETLVFQSEDGDDLLKQEEVEIQKHKQPGAKSNNKKQPISQETQSRKNVLLQNDKSPPIHGDAQKIGHDKEEIDLKKKPTINAV